jgi:hypothetical protein
MKNSEAAMKAAEEATKAAQKQAEEVAAAATKTAAEEKPKNKKEKERAAQKQAEEARAAAAAEEEESAQLAANVRDSAPAGTKQTSSAPTKSGPSSEFQDFIERRKMVEDAIEKDPTLLKRADVRNAYERYLRKTFDIRGKWGKKKAKDAAAQKINDRLKDIEVFEDTRKMIDDLHGKIYR